MKIHWSKNRQKIHSFQTSRGHFFSNQSFLMINQRGWYVKPLFFVYYMLTYKSKAIKSLVAFVRFFSSSLIHWGGSISGIGGARMPTPPTTQSNGFLGWLMCARICWITFGSSMQAMILTGPWQCLHTLSLAAKSQRKAKGTLNTHCRIGCFANTLSARRAALSTIRLTPQLGQNPRRLQLNATNCSWWHDSHCTRKKPYSSRPHCRYASNSSWTYWGSDLSNSDRWDKNRG